MINWPGLGLLNLLSALGRQLDDALVYVDPVRRVVRLSPGVVERTAQLALEAVPGLARAEAWVEAEHMVFALVTRDGTRVRFQLRPETVSVQDGEFRFTARVPGGLELGHEQPWLAAVTQLVDGLFRLGEAQVGTIPGLSLVGEELIYRRPLVMAGTEAWLVPLVQFVQGVGWPTSFPVGFHDGWLELSVGPRS